MQKQAIHTSWGYTKCLHVLLRLNQESAKQTLYGPIFNMFKTKCTSLPTQKVKEDKDRSGI